MSSTQIITCSLLMLVLVAGGATNDVKKIQIDLNDPCEELESHYVDPYDKAREKWLGTSRVHGYNTFSKYLCTTAYNEGTKAALELIERCSAHRFKRSTVSTIGRVSQALSAVTDFLTTAISADDAENLADLERSLSPQLRDC